MWQTEEIERGQRLVEEMRARWRAVALSTQPLDTHRAEAAIAHAYQRMGWEPPSNFHYVTSPRAGQVMMATRDRRTNVLFANKALSFQGRYEQAVRHTRNISSGLDGLFDDVERMTQRILDAVRMTVGLPLTCCGGQFDAGWLCYQDYLQKTHRAEGADAGGMMEIAQECGPWWPYPDACVISAKPTQIMLDSSGRLHNPNGPALLYPDEYKVWALHGVLMEKRTIKRLDRLSARRIEMTRNVEQRRALMEYYGEARYLSETGARIVHRDDFGTLYRKEEQEGEPLVMVKVVNSTPEPDGTYKDYFLRVPPKMTRAQEAVAWTFGLETQTYAPVVET